MKRGHQYLSNDETPPLLKHWFPIFGDGDLMILPQNGYFVNFLENGAYFFYTLHNARGYRYLKNGEDRISIDAFLQELWPKNWADDVIIWAQIQQG